MTSSSNPDDEIRALQLRLSAAEARADQLEQWLDVAFETSAAAMGIISGAENRYVHANAALAELFGMPLEEILSSDPFTLVLKITHPDDLVAEQKLFAEVAVGARRSYRCEKRYVRRDGSIRWGLLTLSGIYEASKDPGAPVGALRFVVAQVIDITERKALADALLRCEGELRHAQKVDGIGRLAAGVAHDFNNLLTVITGHSELLKRRLANGGGAPSGAKLEPNLEAIILACERAASLTAQLLAHGRRETVVRRAIRLSDAVGTLQQLLSRTMESNIEVEQSLMADGSILADQGQIGQVVMNLVLNARDAMPAGGRIRIVTEDLVVGDDAQEGAVLGPGAWVVLVVADTGDGMSPEVQARMFEPFFTTRADRPGTQGTGLGLATVQRIVAESGGRLDVRTARGAGTTITVFFPRIASAPQVIERPEAHVRPLPAPNSQRVLVVEDDSPVRSLVASVLLGAHYWVMAARNGEEALQFIEAEREPFHLIVTDLMMPGIGGVSLAKRLAERGIEPRVLFISGYSSHTESELLPHGTLLLKPFTPARLLAAVSEALDG